MIAVNGAKPISIAFLSLKGSVAMKHWGGGREEFLRFNEICTTPS